MVICRNHGRAKGIDVTLSKNRAFLREPGVKDGACGRGDVVRLSRERCHDYVSEKRGLDDLHLDRW
jgi:hypothetical protein